MASMDALGLDPRRVQDLLSRVERDVAAGVLPAAQVALARHGKVGVAKSFGAASDQSLICLFSATKGVVSAAAWLLFQEGKLDEEEFVADIIPEFGTHGKDQITVQQLFTHTSGFPYAPFSPLEWNSKQETLARFAKWRLTREPGTRFEYHASSSMWVIAELIERRGGLPFTQFIRERMLDPLGLNDLYIGLPEAEHQRTLPVEHCGEAMAADELKKLGLPPEITEDILLIYNRADVRAVGAPASGGYSNAIDLALLYQAMLNGGIDGGVELWNQEIRASVREIRTGSFIEGMFRTPANRGLGIIVSGDATRHRRGFGVSNSPLAFGHNGVGGQLAWADPATGISLAFLTPGHDRNIMQQIERGAEISRLAADCAL